MIQIYATGALQCKIGMSGSNSEIIVMVKRQCPAIFSPVQIDSLVQDCSNSSALAMELLQSCTKPSKWYLPCKFFSSAGPRLILLCQNAYFCMF